MNTIGIDIEMISIFPNVKDFKTEAFYIDNFTPNEIAYCISQNNPIQSFAGLFCAKEAIFKAGFNKENISYSDIEIEHDEKGKPIFEGFNISIAHTSETAVAVAINNF